MFSLGSAKQILIHQTTRGGSAPLRKKNSNDNDSCKHVHDNNKSGISIIISIVVRFRSVWGSSWAPVGRLWEPKSGQVGPIMRLEAVFFQKKDVHETSVK